MLANCPKSADSVERILGFSMNPKRENFGNKAGIINRKSIEISYVFKNQMGKSIALVIEVCSIRN